MKRSQMERYVAACLCVVCLGCADSPPKPQDASPSPLLGSPKPHGASPASLQPPPTPSTQPTPNATLPQLQSDPEQLKFGMVTIGTASEPGLGYGVVFDKSSTGFDVITAEHLLGDRKNIVVHAWQGQDKAARLQAFLSVTVMHRDPARDLAWLRVRGGADQLQSLTLAKASDREQVAAWTYSIVKQSSVFTLNEIERSVTAKRDALSSPVVYWRLKDRIEPGLSGGGLVNALGQWIGIASGNSQGQAHYVDQSEIEQFLKAAGLR